MRESFHANLEEHHLKFQGIGVSSGIVIGKAFRLEKVSYDIKPTWVRDADVEQEVTRFLDAVQTSKDQLWNIRKKIEPLADSDQVRIIDAHLMIMDDTMITNETVEYIRRHRLSAEWSLKRVLDKLAERFDTIDDAYLKERKDDLTHIGNRIFNNLFGYSHTSLADLKEDVIVVAHDLSPTDTAQMRKERVIGFVTEIGSKTSHTAIMAHSLEIPAVVGVSGIYEAVNTGESLIVDSMNGVVLLSPSQEEFITYLDKQRRYKYYERELLQVKDLPTLTTDEKSVTLLANIEFISEVKTVIERGGKGIGLYRTEFLYMDRYYMPSEAEHFRVYKNLAEQVSPYPSTIRTLDLGGDKFISQLHVYEELNPVMGLRAIRLCLEHVALFKTQLRAILRASHYGKLKIMYPMISGIDELRSANAVLQDVKAELRHEGIPFDEAIEVGIMIEIPSAALTADILAQEADFFSIGTNDLIQYAIAIDRINKNVAYLYDPLHPAILRLIAHVIETGHNHGIPVSMCGEVASDPKYTLLLLGLGLDEYSTNPDALLKIKKIIRSVSFSDAQQIAQQALSYTSPKDTDRFITDLMESRFPDIFCYFEDEAPDRPEASGSPQEPPSS
ncbi:phosphoenolpyruvate--protein phosphotransferase [candidate division KSB3 bacterium]|uniref:Phosphoenolpyruvate-protein phosphotransferase n=1 Tax=candidate division KSB3 bacterium TaxID=2044937 RepID=A0A9D5K0I5_9BACT|nr:phosphoenolpyruvate--protein phosphotransferase [candidate division KSB3 bacterium]MBD3327543.1 phosphoenolpyruvate--protein phosphotransferase [candidate division KSB3 bacterium]